jgi:hypothetical protein
VGPAHSGIQFHNLIHVWECRRALTIGDNRSGRRSPTHWRREGKISDFQKQIEIKDEEKQSFSEKVGKTEKMEAVIVVNGKVSSHARRHFPDATPETCCRSGKLLSDSLILSKTTKGRGVREVSSRKCALICYRWSPSKNIHFRLNFRQNLHIGADRQFRARIVSPFDWQISRTNIMRNNKLRIS